jgi:hypothetical protein
MKNILTAALLGILAISAIITATLYHQQANEMPLKEWEKAYVLPSEPLLITDSIFTYHQQ